MVRNADKLKHHCIVFKHHNLLQTVSFHTGYIAISKEEILSYQRNRQKWIHGITDQPLCDDQSFSMNIIPDYYKMLSLFTKVSENHDRIVS